jgi:hypothetical protein
MQLSQELPKKQNTSFLNTPKRLFISGPRHLAHAKIIEKRPKERPMKKIRNNRKEPKILHKS